MPTYSYVCEDHKCRESYEEVLPISEYQKQTKCPKCGHKGKKIIELAQKEPTFSDKIFPYYDRALNKVFESKSQRSSYLKMKKLSDNAGGTMTRKQERQLYDWRLGRFDRRIARHALRD